MKHIWILGVFLAGACSTASDSGDDPQAFEKITFASTQATATERADCEAVGGTIMRHGRLGAEHCVQPYPDAGEACSDASECLGRCLLEEEISNPVPGTASPGVCQENTNDFGCRTLINGGKIEGTICID